MVTGASECNAVPLDEHPGGCTASETSSARQSTQWLIRKTSQLMVDKLSTVPVDSIGTAVSVLEVDELDALDLALRAWLDLA